MTELIRELAAVDAAEARASAAAKKHNFATDDELILMRECATRRASLFALLKPPAPVVPAAPPAPVDPTATRAASELAAIVALSTIGPNAAEIARRIGVKRTTLLGWPTFKAHYDRVRGEAEARRNALHGHRAGESDFARDD